LSTNNNIDPSKWLTQYGDYLFSYALLKIGNRVLAEDLVQDTFLAAIRAKETFKGESSEKTWLISILKNKIIDAYRKKDILKNTSQYLGETEEQFSSQFFDPSDGHWLPSSVPASWSDSPDSALNDKEFDGVLQLCVQKMPPRLVAVFVAKYVDEEDSEIICKVHSLSPSNFWVILHRAKVLVRSCLEKNWFQVKRGK
jgi:RNA polymerase sigma-70 factor (TIGR02943 family)